MTIGPWKKCTVKDCSKKHVALSFCRLHYLRFKSTGNPLGLRKIGGHNKGTSPICRIKNCEKISRGLRLCVRHYSEHRRIGSADFWLKYEEDVNE